MASRLRRAIGAYIDDYHHDGEDLDLLAGGERLGPVEDVAVADVSVLGAH